MTIWTNVLSNAKNVLWPPAENQLLLICIYLYTLEHEQNNRIADPRRVSPKKLGSCVPRGQIILINP